MLGPSRGVSYGVGMPTDLLHHQSGSTMSRLAYGQSPVGLYAQNQPLPAGRCTGEVTVLQLHLFGEPLVRAPSVRWSCTVPYTLPFLPVTSRYSDEQSFWSYKAQQ